ncbi:MAG: ATP synthase F1 subunit delta [Dehalococcoidales bacterium]
MAGRFNAGRYAQAAFEIASQTDELDAWHKDLKLVARLAGEAKVLAFMEDPKIRFKTKTGLLKEHLGGINPLVLNLAYILIDGNRLDMMGEVTAGFERRLMEKRGVERAEVATAVPLSEDDKARLVKRLSDFVGKKIVLKARVEPGLISGMVARIGDKLIDGSTASGLATLKRQLSEGGL